MRKFLGVLGWLVVAIAGAIHELPLQAEAQDKMWTKTYGGTNDDYGWSVQECVGGGFIIAGFTYSFGAGECDVYLIRTGANGDTMWTKTYGGTDYDYGRSVQECAGGGFIIAGWTYSFGAGYYDVYLIRTNANGDALWIKTYGGTRDDGGWSVQECASGGFIIAGWTCSFGAGGADVYLIRISDAGVEEQKELRVESLELRVYPNPCFGDAVIKYGLLEKGGGSLKLYDLGGKLVKNVGVSAGSCEIAVNLDDLANGIYFVKLEADNYKATKKLTILK
jgi:hypothetical protein